jgi:hypothetical protein
MGVSRWVAKTSDGQSRIQGLDGGAPEADAGVGEPGVDLWTGSRPGETVPPPTPPHPLSPNPPPFRLPPSPPPPAPKTLSSQFPISFPSPTSPPSPVLAPPASLPT